MDFGKYVEIEAWNWSLLKEGRKSARHIAHRRAEPKEDTVSLAMGRAVHTSVLEPDRFPLDYAVWDGDRRGKAFAAFAEQHPDHTILRASEYETCLGMRNAVRSHAVASQLLAKGEAEKTLTWVDEETGLPCKARLDWLCALGLVDLKSTSTVDPVLFGMTAGRLGYHGQMAFYARGLRAALGREISSDFPARIIAVETAAPHDVAVFTLSDDDIALGDMEVSRLLRLVADCSAKGEWPGACPGETPLVLPTWLFKQAGWGGDDDLTGLDLEVPAATEA